MFRRSTSCYDPPSVIMRMSKPNQENNPMRRTYIFSIILVALVFIPAVFSQGGQQDSSRTVAGGGVTVPGWTGKVDAREASQGMTLNNAKFAKEADAFHIVTGPAVTYWNAGNKASG